MRDVTVHCICSWLPELLNVEQIEQYPLGGEQTKVAIKGSPDRRSWRRRRAGAEHVPPVSPAAAGRLHTVIEKQFLDGKTFCRFE